MMLRAFNRDFQRNGPSTMRIVRTTLAGWKRYKNHPDARIRRPFRLGGPRVGHHLLRRGGRRAAAITAAIPQMRAKMSALLAELEPRVRLEVAALLRPSAARTSRGRSAAKRSGWPPAGPTSRPPSTRRTTPAPNWLPRLAAAASPRANWGT